MAWRWGVGGGGNYTGRQYCRVLDKQIIRSADRQIMRVIGDN